MAQVVTADLDWSGQESSGEVHDEARERAPTGPSQGEGREKEWRRPEPDPLVQAFVLIDLKQGPHWGGAGFRFDFDRPGIRLSYRSHAFSGTRQGSMLAG